MVSLRPDLKSFLAALLLALAGLAGVAAPATAQGAADAEAELLRQLRESTPETWRQIEERVYRHWSQSGSPSMDLLLRRGREALEAEDPALAIEHFTALTDHAPDFAEGYHLRATAYYRLDLYGPAIDDLGRALTLNPNHFGAMTGLAVLLEETGEPGRALEVFRMAATIHPQRPDVSEAIERLAAQLADVEI
jgi:tetratricopeptide (TPR) repeat protein